MHVIGTAGHVDHGKSALIEALTGIHPDRLAEERERGLTIVLGFAWLTLPNGEEIGIVDVPGHRDFIENMLSGVGAVEAALFVVAADEGVMPQTREHLAILDLLQIQGGVVALTKIDLIDDPEWLDLVEMDLHETLTGTVLETAPVVRVSAKTGEGIPKLLDVLSEQLSGRPQKPDLGRPRLAVDRAFSLSGFGTIVTGTLLEGHFQTGEIVDVLPTGRQGRIRGLQTHQRKADTAIPGSRTAVNISGIDVGEIQRGDVVAYPGQYSPTRRLDVHIRVLTDILQPIRHNSEMKLFAGASEVMARVRLLGADRLKSGDEGWLQLELNEPIVVVRGDRYILRRPSPGETIGGGIVLDPHPSHRYKRYDQNVLDRLDALVDGTPEDILLQASLLLGVATYRELVARANLAQGTADEACKQLIDDALLIPLDSDVSEVSANSLVMSRAYWELITAKAKDESQKFHIEYPLRAGIPREAFKSKLEVASQVFKLLMERWIADGMLAERYIRSNLPGLSPIPVVLAADFQVEFTPDQDRDKARLMAEFKKNPYSPPSVKECIAGVGEDLYNALVDAEEIIPLTQDVVFQLSDYRDLVRKVEKALRDKGTISVAEVRDQFQTSRKYVLALLEHMDAIGVTMRDGDVRKLRQR